MAYADSTDIDTRAAPFDQFKGIHRLSRDRSGRDAGAHTRHQLFAARDRRTAANVLIKVTSKPGLVYQQNLTNEIDSLTTINRALPDSRTFPLVLEHGKIKDGRAYLITNLFDEFPLAASIGPERIPGRLVGHLRTAIEIARALTDLHGIPIVHVDLNPMNVLFRTEGGRPVIRIVDFESSYDVARHAHGVFYNPPTTPNYSAPEVARQPPDPRADVYSLGAVLYTMVAGFAWTWEGDASSCLRDDGEVDGDFRTILARAVDPDPGERYATMAEFRAALASYLEQIWPGRTW